MSPSNFSPVQLPDTDAEYRRTMEQAQPGGPHDVRWELSYDRASVARFTAEVDQEVARLEAEIEAARAHITAAASGVADRDVAGKAELGDLVLAAQKEVAGIEHEHHLLIALIREAAEAEATRQIAAARAEAEAIRDAARMMGASVRRPRGLSAEPSDAAAASTFEMIRGLTRSDAG